MSRWLAIAGCTLAFGLCSSAALAAERCTASVYSVHDADQTGTRTASGIRLNDRIPTMAHKTLPLGSHARVTNRENGKSIDLLVTDRGPYVRGRCADLTPAAARAIACHDLCPVTVEPVH